MSGGIPSGSDPAGYAPTSFSIVGAMVAGLQARDETNVRAQLTDEVQNNTTLTTMSNMVFAGINPQLGIIAGTIEAILRKVIGSIPVVGPIAEDWTENLLDQLGTYYTNLGSLLANLNFLDPDFDPVDAATEFVNLMLLPLNMLLGPNSALNANNIFNLIPVGLLGFLPASHIGDANVNLITNPDFEGDDPIESDVYTLDLTTSFSEVGGSAKVHCDGSGGKDLLSPDLIRVSNGQEVSISARVKWASVVSSGSPIRVGITGYTSGGSPIIQPDMATHTALGTQDWIEMGGTYKITNPSVVAIRLRLTVATTATSGDVWWDHVDLHKINKISLGLLADDNGNGLPDILDSISADINNFLNLIPGFASVSDLLDLKDVLGGSFGSDIQAVINNLEHMLTTSSPIPGGNIIGEIVDDVVPGLITTVGSIVSGLLNIPFGNYSHADASSALTHTAETLSTLSAQVAALQVQAGTGIVGGDDFERTASNAGPNWTFDYTGGAGTMKVDGHNLYFDGNGFDTRTVKGLFLPLTLATDYQNWSVTLNGSPETADQILLNLPPIAGGTPAYNDVFGRMNAARTDYIQFRVGKGKAILYRCVGGFITELNQRDFPTPGPGSTLNLQCGQLGSNSRYFRGTVNGQTAVDIVEIGTASPVDSNHRQGGLGGQNGAWLGAFRQSRMGSIKQFLGSDQ